MSSSTNTSGNDKADKKTNETLLRKLLNILIEYWLIILMVLLVSAAIYISLEIYITYKNHFSSIYPNTVDNRGDWGTVGDFFGGILNPIFAFFGLIMLLATLFQSQRELSLTRKELELARKANEESEKALKDQALTQAQQRFENTFFALLEQHNNLLERIENNEYKLDINWNSLYIEDEDNNLVFKSSKQQLHDLFIRRNGFLLRNYFMSLYQILKFIYINQSESKISLFKINPGFITDTSTLTPQEDFYVKLIFSYINETIICLIMINCLQTNNSNTNYPKFKALIERYGLFKNLSLITNETTDYPKKEEEYFFTKVIDNNCFLNIALKNRDRMSDNYFLK